MDWGIDQEHLRLYIRHDAGSLQELHLWCARRNGRDGQSQNLLTEKGGDKIDRHLGGAVLNVEDGVYLHDIE